MTSGKYISCEEDQSNLRSVVEKAENPLPDFTSITECSVVDRFEGGLVRDIIHIGQPVRKVLTFYPRQRVHVVRTHGAARGTIDNEIGLDERNEPVLTFTFHIAVDGVETGRGRNSTSVSE